MGKIKNIFTNKQKITESVRCRETKPLSKLKCVIYPLYYFFDYLLMYPILYIHKYSRHGAMLIFDRYFYDYMYQQQFKNCSRQVLKLLAMLVPSPDINVVLIAEPNIIHSRKNELGQDEIRTQIESLQDVFAGMNNVLWLNGENSIGDNVQEIVKVLVHNLNKDIKK